MFPRHPLRALSIVAITTLATGASTATAVVATNPPPVCSNGDCTITFPAVGDHYAWTVPANTSALSLDVQGAAGGTANTPTPIAGGAGARVQATMSSVAGTTLFIYPGGQGASSSTYAAGGWNGGGIGRDPRGYSFNRYGGGGGASDIRTTAGDLASRIIVAGGGGGAAGYSSSRRAGGAGGQSGLAGQAEPIWGQPGGGATPSAGGAGGPSGAYAGGAGTLGIGGDGNGCTIADGCDGVNGYSNGGAGGGGGLYGGGGGGGTGYPPGAGGGGSSGVATPVTGPTYTTGFRTSSGLVVISYTQYELPVFSAASPDLNATVGTPYSYTFTATGLPAPTLATTGTLPPGLLFDATTGTLSGTPTAAGAFDFAVTATNLASTTTTTTYRLQVAAAPSSESRPSGPASPAESPVAASASTRTGVASARGARRVVSNGRIATVTQDVRLSLDGRYTFIFVRPDGSRIPLSPGSRISARPTARTTTAPVRVVTGPDPLVRVSALMGSAAASGARLRVIRKAPDGALTDATIG